MFHDEGVLIFVVFVPLIYPVLYSWVYTNEVVRDVPVAVVDMSHSQSSRDFIRRYDATPDVRVAVYAPSLDAAKALVRRGEVNGVLHIPADFEQRIQTMQQTPVSIYADMSLILCYKAIYQAAIAVINATNADIQTKLGGGITRRDDQLLTAPIRVSEVPIFNAPGGYGNFVLPAVLIIIIQQTFLLGVGLIGGTDNERRTRRAGVTGRAGVSPADATQTDAAMQAITTQTDAAEKAAAPYSTARACLTALHDLGISAVAWLTLYAVVAAYILLVVPRLFGFVQLAHAADLVALVVPFLLAVFFMAKTLAAFVPRREDIMLLVVFTSVGLLFLAGLSWPQFAIPRGWYAFSCLFPTTFAAQGFIRINSMGALAADIAPLLQALWLQAAAYFFTAWAAMACKEKRRFACK